MTLPLLPALLLLAQAQPATQPATTRPAEPIPVTQIEVAETELTPAVIRDLRERFAKSVVIIEYVWEGEEGRQELEGIGLVVGEGRVMAPLDLVPLMLPDAQVSEFKVKLPRRDADPTELDATLAGRDERANVLYVEVAPDQENAPAEWTAVNFGEGELLPGQPVVSIGRLPESAGYTAYVTTGRVSANLRGPKPTVVVEGGLAGTGAVVLDMKGRAIGLVDRFGRRSPFLTGSNPVDLLESPPVLFVPTSFLVASLESPPTGGNEPAIPYLGVERMTGLSEDLRDYYGLSDRPAVQVGDVLENSPAAEAGVRSGDVIVAMNGDPLERGDTAEEQPDIFERNISRMDVGGTVTLTLLNAAREERQVEVTLSERPMQARQAERWYAEDLGFSVRELVFADRYVRKLPAETPGVAVAFVREQSNAAAAGLRVGDLIRQINQVPVESLDQFREAYQTFREENPSEAVVLEVLRGPETQIIRIEAPQ